MDAFSQLVTYINLLSLGEKLGERAKYVCPAYNGWNPVSDDLLLKTYVKLF